MDNVMIKQTDNSGWYAVNLTTGQTTIHYNRKTSHNAAEYARKLWGDDLNIFVKAYLPPLTDIPDKFGRTRGVICG